MNIDNDVICNINVCRRDKDLEVQDGNYEHICLKIPVKHNIISVQLNSHHVRTLVDTGAEISCICEHVLKECGVMYKLGPSNLNVVGVCGERHGVLGTIDLPFTIGRLQMVHKVYVFRRLHHQMILGMDFMTQHKSSFDVGNSVFKLYGGLTETPIQEEGLNHVTQKVAVSTVNVKIPANSQCLIPVTLKDCDQQLVMLEPHSTLCTRNSLIGAKALVSPKANWTMYQVFNPSEMSVTLTAGKVVATVIPIHEEIEINSISMNKDSTTPERRSPDKKMSHSSDSISFNIGSGLNHDQNCKLEAFLNTNRDIFASSMEELSEVKGFCHKIDTGSAAPIRRRFYRTSPEIKKQIQIEVDKMLQAGIIEPSEGEWCSPVVLVKKKSSNDWRFCVDFRALNGVTRPSVFPIPRYDDVIDLLGEKKPKIFTTLDMSRGYWQVKMSEESKEKTSFITHNGIYQFNKMPYGLMNSGNTFQMIMSRVLNNMTWQNAIVYIDDVLCFSNNYEEHIEHLSAIFDRLRSANLKLNPKKCYFAREEVTYLGHTISSEGIRVDQEKVKAVLDFPRPKSAKEVRSYLRLCSYYRRFIKDFAKIANPLNALLKKDVKFKWTETCENAFITLKEKLTSARVLAYPDMNKQFILTSDASGSALACTLPQIKEDGLEHPIAYYGRALRMHERKWAITERECLAFLEGIRNFKTYLSNQKFVIVTDHQCLKWLQSNRQDTGRLARWSFLLQEFDYEVQYRQGKKIPHVDSLSRRGYAMPSSNEDLSDICYDNPISAIEIDSSPDNQEQTCAVHLDYNECSDNLNVCVIDADKIPEPDMHEELPITSEIDIQKLHEECELLKPIVDYLKNDILPSDIQEANKVCVEAKQYIISDNILYHLFERRNKGKCQDQRFIRLRLRLRTVYLTYIKVIHNT